MAAERVLEKGTLVVRDGMIEAVGADVQPPADARIWDLRGKTIYPGLIDAMTESSFNTASTQSGSPHWNDLATPQLSVADLYKADEAANEKFRSQGVTVRLVAPETGILKGVSAAVTTGDGTSETWIVKSDVALHLELTVPPGRQRRQFPNSPMGAVALARQAFLDARWYQDAWEAFRRDASLSPPERNDALQAMSPFLAGAGRVIVEANDEQYFLRADRFAREFGLNLVVCGSGHEYRRLEAIAASNRPVLVPLNFPKAPNVGTTEAAMSVSLEELLHWDSAPENAARLAKAGVKIALTSHRLADKGEFLSAVKKAIDRGLKHDAALRALTTTPAEILGIADRVGTLEPGKAAHLVIANGDLFDEKTKVLETWIDGRRYEVEETPWRDVRGQWRITLDQPVGEVSVFHMNITGQPKKLGGTISLISEGDGDEGKKIETKLSHVSLRDARFAATFDGDLIGKKGVVRLSAVVSFPTKEEATWIGSATWPDGESTALHATRTAEYDDEQEDGDAKTKTSSETARKDALFAVNYPLGAFGRAASPDQPNAVLFQNVTVWTCGGEGVLENASVLVGRGKVLAVGRELEIPRGAIVIDAQGKHLTPGIIDCHSHMATDGGINETGQAITAEVRIGDFIDATDINIYRQLAGGVTSANVLHGSANPIGGQNQVIKLRWGDLPERMKFAQAPPGIKFALGENVKQSNWGEDFATRYPQSRMGVEQIIRDAFAAAKQYRLDHKKWTETRQGLPPRVDLELEAVAEIVEKKRWIHCHSYRQDEILALLRTLDDFKLKIGTFQHILEGYKVADAMAKHGAMGSAFSDWWAYKFEVYDAIPYAGALMHDAGVVVSFNSDDAELARHLNQEAAKAVKYGGVPVEEALKFVTLNPARQLRIEKYVGSIEPGKDADLVLWSGPPLSNFSRCEQTWIDGRKYFDLQEDLEARKQAHLMRAKLIQRVIFSGDPMRDEGETDDEMLYRLCWPRIDVFCGHHHHDGHQHHEHHEH
jgi:N-acetylglucosamine-6-phosphate deacetylase